MFIPSKLSSSLTIPCREGRVVEVRRAYPGDAGAYRKLMSAPGSTRYLRKDFDAEREEGQLESELFSVLNSPGESLYAITEEGKTLGFLGLQQERMSLHVILWVALLPEYWGKGIGTYVLEAVVSAYPVRTVFRAVCCDVDSRGVSMLTQTGFSPLGPGHSSHGYAVTHYIRSVEG